MEIDAPPHAIAIWLEGDAIMVRLPDHQLLRYETVENLMITLRHRASKARPRTVGTKAAPVQYDIDVIDYYVKRDNGVAMSWDEKAKTAGARRRIEEEERNKKRLLRKDAKRIAMKEADETLALVGL